jgi:hypothetical protein
MYEMYKVYHFRVPSPRHPEAATATAQFRSAIPPCMGNGPSSCRERQLRERFDVGSGYLALHAHGRPRLRHPRPRAGGDRARVASQFSSAGFTQPFARRMRARHRGRIAEREGDDVAQALVVALSVVVLRELVHDGAQMTLARDQVLEHYGIPHDFLFGWPRATPAAGSPRTEAEPRCLLRRHRRRPDRGARRGVERRNEKKVASHHAISRVGRRMSAMWRTSNPNAASFCPSATSAAPLRLDACGDGLGGHPEQEGRRPSRHAAPGGSALATGAHDRDPAVGGPVPRRSHRARAIGRLRTAAYWSGQTTPRIRSLRHG